MKKIAVVTGGSSGIGLAVVNEFVAKGYTVFELSRRELQEQANVIHIKTDVMDEGQLNSAFDTITNHGAISALVCCAGGGISGAVEFTEKTQANWLFELNFFGVVNTVKAALPSMRKNGGNIVIISSVASVLPIPFQTYYSATKAALNEYACALANEVKPFGIGVCAILPGDIKTGFTDSRKKLHFGDDIYGGRISHSVEQMEHDEQNGDTPEAAALFITKIAGKRKIKPLYVIGFKYRLFVLASKLLPIRLVNFIVGKLYG